ncbi:MAG: hypothetical protein ACRDKI_03940 [Solirubrobacterales bacterium]
MNGGSFGDRHGLFPVSFWANMAAVLTSELLTDELTSSVRSGITLRAVLAMPTLLGLDVVKAKALSDRVEDVGTAALGLLRESSVRVDEEADGTAAILMGLATGTKGMPAPERRRKAARSIPTSFDNFRKRHEGELLSRLAEELVAADSIFRSRQNHRAQVPDAIDSRLRVNWLERHEAYRRIWSPVSALRADLLVLLEYLKRNRVAGIALEQIDDESPAPWPDVADRAMNLLWRRAQFTRELNRFVEEYGGLWLLSDPDKESQVAEAIFQIEHHGPFGSADDSWLRLRLAEVSGEELDPFIDAVYAEEAGTEALRSVLNWADQCKCPPEGSGDSYKTCEVHKWLSACDRYTLLIDEDWDAVADWYRRPRS